MKALLAPVLAAALLAVPVSFPASAAAGPGLYQDESKEVTTGDLNNQDYWWTKFDMMMLDIALKQHQPEGQIGLDLTSTQKRLQELVKLFPKHAELRDWKAYVESVIAKIDPNAQRGQGFNPGCPWDESNFAQAWVNFHWAKMQLDARHDQDALGLLQNVTYNLGLLTEKEDRLKDYPDDLRKWVLDTKPIAQKMYDDLKAKMHR